MSPALAASRRARWGFPRASGDEPRRQLIDQQVREVFPARAGMSPNLGLHAPNGPGFPRASGDEPETIMSHYEWHEFSPRERG